MLLVFVYQSLYLDCTGLEFLLEGLVVQFQQLVLLLQRVSRLATA